MDNLFAPPPPPVNKKIRCQKCKKHSGWDNNDLIDIKIRNTPIDLRCENCGEIAVRLMSKDIYDI